MQKLFFLFFFCFRFFDVFSTQGYRDYLKNFDSKKYHLKKGANGYLFYIDNENDFIKKALFSDTGWEPEILDLLKKYVRKDSVFVDIGAHIGIHSIPISKFIGPSGKVVCFECQPKIVSELLMNIHANNCKNIEVIPYVASDSDGEKIELAELLYGNEGATKCYGKSGFFCQTMTLDSLKLENVSVIKIDVEQTEDMVLKGSLKTIKNNRPFMIVEIMGGPLECSYDEYLRRKSDTITFIEELGYRVVQSNNDWDFYCFPLQSGY